MIDRKAKLYIDIVNGIDLIHEFIGTIDLFEEYTVDLKTKSAIERQLGIVGEAIKRIKDIDPNESIQYRDEIIGFRNILRYRRWRRLVNLKKLPEPFKGTTSGKA